MQKLLFFLLFCLLRSISAFSQGQCESYRYQIDLNNFACESEPGNICFVTSANWVDYLECKDYVIELEYETGNFMYTDLGDFYLHSQTQNLVILRHIPQFSTDGLTIGCLEGVLQVPGTVFTIRVVWPTNPNDVIASSTFTIDAPKIIGSPGQTTLLSDAIANSDLLPASQAAIQGQTIAIEGTLVIDENYGFGTSPGNITNEIIMRQGAKIEVGTHLEGFFLGTDYTDIYSCDGTWDRILLRPESVYSGFNTRISDATVAVELLDQSELNISRMVMDNNGIGIASFGASPKDIDVNLFTSNYDGILIQNGNEGCHFENVDLLNFSANLLVKNMTNNGIYLDHTDMIGDRNYYYNCPIGVHVATSNNLLDLSRCEFVEGQCGVLSLGSLEMSISNSFFQDLTNGIARGSSVVNEHTLIEDNIMEACSTNVIGVVQPSQAEIQFNQLSADQTNVVVFGYGNGLHHWAVQHNEAMYVDFENETGNNVTLLNLRDARIYKNITPFSALTNFSVVGGSDVKVGYNTDVNSDMENIRVNGSPRALVYCNTTYGNTGLTFLNNCSGAIVRGNDMTSWGYNLSYGTPNNTFASTGPQYFKGNIFDPSSEGNPKAVNYSVEQVAEQNQYQVGFLAGAQGSELYPYFISDFDEWFIKNENGEDYQCPPGLIGDEPREEELNREVKNYIELLDTDVESFYGAELSFDVSLKLYRSLVELKQFKTLSESEQAWYNSLSNSSIASFIFFEQILHNAGTLSESETSLANQLKQDIHAMENDLQNISWYSMDGEMGAVVIDQEQRAVYDQKLAAVKIKTSELEALLKARNQILLKQWDKLYALNEGIYNMTTNAAQNLKSANRLLLRRISPSFAGYTPGELQLLQDIAGQCSGTGGEGVFTARALFAETTWSLPEYNDECITNPGAPRDATSAASYNSIHIAPNPAIDYITINLPKERQYSVLALYDLLGRELNQIELAENQQTITISTSMLVPGVYYLVPLGSMEEAVKLVVKR